MYRDPLLELLMAYRSKWNDESAVVDRMIKFIKEYPNCFERSLLYGHITASAWVINNERTHTLLTHHKKLNRWLQLGGHTDGDPDVRASALREVAEESGLNQFKLYSPSIFDIDIHSIPARNDEPEHTHFDVRFIVLATGDENYVVSDESHDLEWVSIADIREFTKEESMLRMARKCEMLFAQTS